MNTSPLEELLQKGIEAARAGQKETARDLLEQVVEQDQYSEKGWFWLAAVVDDVTEKRVCLGNVLTVNPQNERAKRLLEQLGGTVPASPPPELPSIPSQADSNSLSRYLIAAGGFIVLVAIGVALLVGRDGGKDDKPTSEAVIENSPVVRVTSTAPRMTTPTPQATRTPVPTWTPAPTIVPTVAAQATPLAPPPASLSGSIILRRGIIFSGDRDLPISIISPDGKQVLMDPTSARGHAPILSPDGSRYAFIRLMTGSGAGILEYDPVQGSEGSWFWSGTLLTHQDTPAWSPDGRWLAFVAVGPDAESADLYRVSIVPASEQATVEQLTSDDAVESWPAYAPNNSRFIVYSALLSDGITELRILDLQTMRSTDLTTDGADLAETSPDWSPNGHWIVFEGVEKESDQSDIYLMSADGTEPPKKIIESPADDIAPRFSPDGNYIVFSSERTGNWDVFIFDLTSEKTYQVTSGPDADIANDWGR